MADALDMSAIVGNLKSAHNKASSGDAHARREQLVQHSNDANAADDYMAQQLREAAGKTPQQIVAEHDAAMMQAARQWTALDEDLAQLATREPARAAAIAEYRSGIAEVDYPRSLHWCGPEGISAITDIAYLPDGGYDAAHGEVRGHLLDIYYPTACQGKSIPVYIDLHGGGFTYGYKALNRNFNTHLAKAAQCAVVCVDYRPAPQASLCGQLADVQAGLRWILEAASREDALPFTPSQYFITGDSAGGALSLFTLAIENSAQMATTFGITQPSGMCFAGGALLSAACNFAPVTADGAHAADGTPLPYGSDGRASIEALLGSTFFAGLEHADPAYLCSSGIAGRVDLPPLYVQTSSEDFIQSESLSLATALASAHKSFELVDVNAQAVQQAAQQAQQSEHTQTEDASAAQDLGHVFPVSCTWQPASQRVLEQIAAFTARCQ